MTEASAFPPPKIRALAAEVVALLKERNETVSVAETAAGGIISASLLAQPGASKVYRGGLTLYTLESRIAFAGWTQSNIDAYRGPNPDVVSGLAENVRARLDSTYAICESGTAGPTGGSTPNRTPGYVALAVATVFSPTVTKEVHDEAGNGTDREANMISFAEEALNLLRDVIKGSPAAGGSGTSAL
ncbi:CinA family protein [Microdochium nivale]|nr:CinA family protein [Microdochium nivale]